MDPEEQQQLQRRRRGRGKIREQNKPSNDQQSQAPGKAGMARVFKIAVCELTKQLVPSGEDAPAPDDNQAAKDNGARPKQKSPLTSSTGTPKQVNKQDGVSQTGSTSGRTEVKDSVTQTDITTLTNRGSKRKNSYKSDGEGIKEAELPASPVARAEASVPVPGAYQKTGEISGLGRGQPTAEVRQNRTKDILAGRSDKTVGNMQNKSQAGDQPRRKKKAGVKQADEVNSLSVGGGKEPSIVENWDLCPTANTPTKNPDANVPGIGRGRNLPSKRQPSVILSELGVGRARRDRSRSQLKASLPEGLRTDKATEKQPSIKQPDKLHAQPGVSQPAPKERAAMQFDKPSSSFGADQPTGKPLGVQTPGSRLVPHIGQGKGVLGFKYLQRELKTVPPGKYLLASRQNCGTQAETLNATPAPGSAADKQQQSGGISFPLNCEKGHVVCKGTHLSVESQNDCAGTSAPHSHEEVMGARGNDSSERFGIFLHERCSDCEVRNNLKPKNPEKLRILIIQDLLVCAQKKKQFSMNEFSKNVGGAVGNSLEQATSDKSRANTKNLISEEKLTHDNVVPEVVNKETTTGSGAEEIDSCKVDNKLEAEDLKEKVDSFSEDNAKSTSTEPSQEKGNGAACEVDKGEEDCMKVCARLDLAGVVKTNVTQISALHEKVAQSNDIMKDAEPTVDTSLVKENSGEGFQNEPNGREVKPRDESKGKNTSEQGEDSRTDMVEKTLQEKDTDLKVNESEQCEMEKNTSNPLQEQPCDMPQANSEEREAGKVLKQPATNVLDTDEPLNITNIAAVTIDISKDISLNESKEEVGNALTQPETNVSDTGEEHLNIANEEAAMNISREHIALHASDEDADVSDSMSEYTSSEEDDISDNESNKTTKKEGKGQVGDPAREKADGAEAKLQEEITKKTVTVGDQTREDLRAENEETTEKPGAMTTNVDKSRIEPKESSAASLEVQVDAKPQKENCPNLNETTAEQEKESREHIALHASDEDSEICTSDNVSDSMSEYTSSEEDDTSDNESNKTTKKEGKGQVGDPAREKADGAEAKLQEEITKKTVTVGDQTREDLRAENEETTEKPGAMTTNEDKSRIEPKESSAASLEVQVDAKPQKENSPNLNETTDEQEKEEKLPVTQEVGEVKTVAGPPPQIPNGEMKYSVIEIECTGKEVLKYQKEECTEGHIATSEVNESEEESEQAEGKGETNVKSLENNDQKSSESVDKKKDKDGDNKDEENLYDIGEESSFQNMDSKIEEKTHEESKLLGDVVREIRDMAPEAVVYKSEESIEMIESKPIEDTDKTEAGTCQNVQEPQGDHSAEKTPDDVELSNKEKPIATNESKLHEDVGMSQHIAAPQGGDRGPSEVLDIAAKMQHFREQTRTIVVQLTEMYHALVDRELGMTKTQTDPYTQLQEEKPITTSGSKLHEDVGMSQDIAEPEGRNGGPSQVLDIAAKVLNVREQTRATEVQMTEMYHVLVDRELGMAKTQVDEYTQLQKDLAIVKTFEDIQKSVSKLCALVQEILVALKTLEDDVNTESNLLGYVDWEIGEMAPEATVHKSKDSIDTIESKLIEDVDKAEAITCQNAHNPKGDKGADTAPEDVELSNKEKPIDTNVSKLREAVDELQNVAAPKVKEEGLPQEQAETTAKLLHAREEQLHAAQAQLAESRRVLRAREQELAETEASLHAPLQQVLTALQLEQLPQGGVRLETVRRLLPLAVDWQNAMAVRHLVALEPGAVWTVRGPGGALLLHRAACCGSLAVLQALLAVQPLPELDTTDDLGLTALHWAAGSARVEEIRLLVNAGADLEARTPEGRTALHLAALAYPQDVLEKLPYLGIQLKASNYASPCTGYQKAVCALVEAGAELEARDETGLTPLLLAAQCGAAEMLRGLVALGARTGAQLEEPLRRTALHVAAEGGHVAAIKVLLEAGAQPNVQDSRGRTPLHAAAENGQAAVIAALLQIGADPAVQDKLGITPFDVAFTVETRRLLLPSV